MKKAIIAILAFLYISTASGVVINVHFCMGHIASVSYGFEGDDACGKCGMKAKKDCCHTEYKVVKLEDAHQLAKAGFQFMQLPVESPVPFMHYTRQLRDNRSSSTTTNHSPPDIRANEVYLYNNVFRI